MSHSIAATATRAQRLALGFRALLGLCWGLIVLGALVRAHDAGLACPDWPLCFGDLVPRMNLKVAFEWTHRLVAGSLSLVFAGLAIACARDAALRARCGRSLLFASALLGVQILLGALTVWHLLAHWTVTAHLLTGNAFAASLLWIALDLGAAAASVPQGGVAASQNGAIPAGAATRTAGAGGMPAWLVACVVLLALQMLLGGQVSSRYAGLACTEWPACNGGEWFPSWGGSVGLHLLHRTNGYLLCALLGASALALQPSRTAVARTLAFAFGLCWVQIGVGVANVLLALPVEVTALHSFCATGLVLLLTHAAWTARRSAEPAAA